MPPGADAVAVLRGCRRRAVGRQRTGAEPEPLPGGPTYELAAGLAAETGAYVHASLYEAPDGADGDGLGFNTAICVAPDGALVARTRKLHIPQGAGYHEDHWFRPGTTGYPTVPVAGATFGFPTCWDQWFPEVARAYSLAGAEVLVYPTAIGSEPELPGFDTEPLWQQVIVANGIANGTFMVAVNRIGTEPPLTFYGSSFISDPYGRILVQAPARRAGRPRGRPRPRPAPRLAGPVRLLRHPPARHVRIARTSSGAEQVTGPAGRWRRVASTVLVVLAALSATVGILAGWADRTLFQSQEFADRATAALDSPAVRGVLAEELADRLVESGVGSLSSFRSVLVPLIEDVEQTPAFHQLFRAAVAEVHSAVFQSDASRAVLELGDTLSILTSTAKGSQDNLVAKLPADGTSLLVDVSPVLHRIQPWRIAQRARWLDDAAWVVTVLAVAGALVVDRRRRRTVLKLGVATVAVGAAIVAITAAVPRLATDGIRDAALADAARHGIRLFMGDLRLIGWWLLPIGVIVAAAATATGAPHILHDGRGALRRAGGWFAQAGRPARALAGVGLIAAGTGLVVYRDDMVPLVLALLGALVAYVGLVHLVTAVFGTAGAVAPGQVRVPRRVARDVTVSVAVVAVSVLAVLVASTAITDARREARASSVLQCNGSASLCSKRLDQVAFPGSHNSMSAALDPGWLFAENLHGIPAQLEYGIRAFLVKTHYGIPTGISVGGSELVVTDKAAEITADEPAEVEELSPDAVAKAKQLESTVPDDPSARGIYLCHVYCSLGATKFSTTLDDIRTFMDRNPDEVIMLFIGDYVTPADTAAEFDKAGLTDRVWTYDASKPPPTLGEMIAAKEDAAGAGRARGGHAPLVHAGLRHLPGHAVHVRVGGRLQLQRQPRAGQRPAVRAQPLHHQQAAAVGRGRQGRQQLRRPDGPREGLRAAAAPVPHDRGRQLLRPGRPVEGGRHPQRSEDVGALSGLVEVARAQALEVERHVAVAGGAHRRHDRFALRHQAPRSSSGTSRRAVSS